MSKKRKTQPARLELWHWKLTYLLLYVRGDKTWHNGQHDLRTHRFRAVDLSQAERFALEHLQQVLRNNERLELEADDHCRLEAENITPPYEVFLLKQYHSRGKLLHLKPEAAATCFSQVSPPEGVLA